MATVAAARLAAATSAVRIFFMTSPQWVPSPQNPTVPRRLKFPFIGECGLNNRA
jgi:hypothetical protein